MLKVLAFLARKPGLTMDEFVDYYENHHVPLIVSQGHGLLGYKRNYIRDGADGVDVVSEFYFANEGSYRSWAAAMYSPETGVADDEANFLDRSKTRSYVVEEHTS
ncbi:EthD family reductase [Kibdelosporangium aridum]|uniref:EthD family reductase n=1 Tax=Kibdelosporangium aridum TaxID=2030 RepID=A0A428YZG3_KIBAR|nr:EthD domain-containing protein [Kibdelosporangium aridum]RSM76968.1 EthD family reductase [Kibdelosporangium aridum]